MKYMKLNPRALGYALAIVSGVGWFLVHAFSLLTGVGKLTVTTIGAYHPLFSYTWGGALVVAIENFICGFVVGWVLAWVYNKYLRE